MPDNAASPALISEAVTGPQGLGIRSKLAMTIGGLVTLALALLAAFALRESRNALLQEATRRGLIIGRNLADYSASAVLQKDPLQAFQFTKDALNDDAMVHALLTDENGVILAIRAASGNPPAQTGAVWQPLQGRPLRMEGLPPTVQVVESKDPETGDPVLAFAFPVIKAEVQVGNAYIALSQAKIQRVVQETTLKVTILSVVFVVLALIAAFLVSNLIVQPLRRLTQGALAVGSGDLGATVAVDSKDELGVLARSFNAMTAGLKRAQQEMLDKQMLMQELNIAQEIQQGLLPKKIPQVNGYELAAYYAPAKEVGGDYYDFIPVGDAEHLAFVVADVSGKGIPAALLMSHMQATLRALLGRNPSLPALATQASELLFASTAPNRYVTAALLDLDVRTGAGRYLSAGHVDCLLARAAGAAVPLASTGAPLGLLPPGMPYEETPVSLEPGDSVLLYSDGVVDAQNADGEEFGEARLLDIVQQMHRLPPPALVDRVFDAIDQHAAGAPQFDDITLLVVRRLE